jgi:hypothetical protein
MEEGYVMPTPPRLKWGWVLALDILTLGLFGIAWLIVQANWSRKATGKRAAFWLSIAFPGFILLMAFAGVPNWAIKLPSFFLSMAARFVLRDELSEDPINIPLSGVMTFFFAEIYFQYHLSDYKPDGVNVREGSSLGLSSS